jgi:hypothetical protein
MCPGRRWTAVEEECGFRVKPNSPSARRFEDERMVYERLQLAGDPNPSGVVVRINWTAVSAWAAVAALVAGVGVFSVLAAPRLRHRRPRE